jgi:hypothetical protein
MLQDMQDYRGIIYGIEGLVIVRTKLFAKTTPFSIGLDELQSHQFYPHEKCPACMMGKSHLNNKPGGKEQSEKPLAKVYMDIFSSSVISIEGHNYSLIITDDCTGYRWLYGLKTKMISSKPSRNGIATLQSSAKRILCL